MVGEIAGKQLAQAGIVVDDEDVRRFRTHASNIAENRARLDRLLADACASGDQGPYCN